MTRGLAVLALLLLAGGACRPPPAPSSPGISARQAAAIVEELDGVLVGREVRVLEVRREPHHYVVVSQRAGEAQPREQAVSLDGALLFDRRRDVARERERLQADKRFAECLLRRGAVVFVRSDDPSSLAQLELLGAAAHRLAIDCALEPGNCAARGVAQVPTTAVGDALFPGMRTRGWFETRTGCK